MKKNILIIFLFVGLAGIIGTYYYVSKLINKERAVQRVQKTQDIDVYFKSAQEIFPQIKQKTANDSPEVQKDRFNTYRVVSLIANRNVEEIKKLPAQDLQFRYGDIWAPGDKFKNVMEGRLASRMLGSENALGFVLLHSALDKTEQDKQATLAMLKILFDKKLNPFIKVGEVYWIKEKPEDKNAYDYVGIFSLSDIADSYSFPEAQSLLKEYMSTYKNK